MLQDTLKNRTIFCKDNLDILQGINSNTIDLIYLDPPFNKKRSFHAPIGSKAEGASFRDTWYNEDIKLGYIGLMADRYPKLNKYILGIENIGSRSNRNYLIYMTQRLIEMHRILKQTGSIYLHCDQTMSHYLKLLMDIIFGGHNFRNEIVWCYRTGGVSKNYFPKKHDILFLYGKGNSYHKALKERIYYEKPFIKTLQDEDGRFYADVYVRDIWENIKPVLNVSKERMDYPTQKPLKLLERIIKASSKEKDIVLDPFCGCATTCIAAEKLHRQWIGIDVSKKAFDILKLRLNTIISDEKDVFKRKKKVIYRDDIPQRTDISRSTKTKTQLKHSLYGRQEGRCHGCGHYFEYRHLHVDHIIPKAKGGGDSESNLQLLCGHCNALKGIQNMAYLKLKLKEYNIL